MTRNLLPAVKDSATSPETLVPGEAERARGVLWENMKFTIGQKREQNGKFTDVTSGVRCSAQCRAEVLWDSQVY